uniref:Retrovirus-related Pol polyprotein from transposon TNT 1-94-like beta-barrel domain-containing protein n=1 Tax=Fagus sylvatica TaxID=28930 RepID=A0A2N9IS84_FAGSY
MSHRGGSNQHTEVKEFVEKNDTTGGGSFSKSLGSVGNQNSNEEENKSESVEEISPLTKESAQRKENIELFNQVGSDIKSGTAQAHNKCFDLVREMRDPWREASDPVREALDPRAYPLKPDPRLNLDREARDSRICPDLAHTLTRLGHYKINCPLNKRPKNKGKEIAMIITKALVIESPSTSWWVDSAATRHIARNRELFVDFKEKQLGEHRVYMGNNTYSDVLGEGKCKFSIGDSVIVLNNVLYVPSVRRNLISIPVLDEKGFEVKMKSGRVFISKDDISVSGVKVDGVDFMDTYSPVAKFASVRIIMVVAARLDLKLHQLDVLKRFKMEDCRPVSTPVSKGTILNKSMCPTNKTELEEMIAVPYAQVVGSLMYTMTSTRQDICYAVGLVSKYQSNPGKAHWQAVKRIFRYLQMTKSMKLCFGLDKLEINGFTDADFAGDTDDRKSTRGYVFLFGGTSVFWLSKQQGCVAKYTMEAEYIACSTAVSNAVWIKSFMDSLKLDMFATSTSWNLSTKFDVLLFHGKLITKGEQNVIDKIAALFETNKDEHLEEKQAEATTVVSELLKESHESELQVGSEKTVETGEDKLEKEKVDEVAKSEDLPKELPAKSTQKQSNNIIFKVKQSLVKTKKAIIGKSPSSKTLSFDTKVDIKVK